MSYVIYLDTPQWGRESISRGVEGVDDLRDNGHVVSVFIIEDVGNALTRLAPNGARDNTRTRAPRSLLLLNTYARRAENT